MIYRVQLTVRYTGRSAKDKPNYDMALAFDIKLNAELKCNGERAERERVRQITQVFQDASDSVPSPWEIVFVR